MRFHYDQAVDVLDIEFADDALVSRTEQVEAGTLVDVDQNGRVVAIEVIRPARRWALEEIIGRFALADDDADVLRSLWTEPNAFPFAEPTELGSGADAGHVLLNA
jgi:uncharacterized protein YuzE